MPLLAAFFFFLSLASLGVPGTSGFPAEFLILVSALQTHTGAGLAALLAMVLGAAYVLDGYRRTFFGPLGNNAIAAAADLRPGNSWWHSPSACPSWPPASIPLGCWTS